LLRLLFGGDHRPLWITPIEVEVLNLRTYVGGLRPVRRGGHSETTSLHLDAADGRTFDFRSVDKDPSRILRPDLRRTVLGWIARDQVSAEYPAGVLVVAPLLEAARVEPLAQDVRRRALVCLPEPQEHDQPLARAWGGSHRVLSPERIHVLSSDTVISLRSLLVVTGNGPMCGAVRVRPLAANRRQRPRTGVCASR
jgi:hypothetical protein